MKNTMIRFAVMMSLCFAVAFPTTGLQPALTADGGVLPGLPPVLKPIPGSGPLADGGVLPGLPPVLKSGEPIPSGQG